MQIFCINIDLITWPSRQSRRLAFDSEPDQTNDFEFTGSLLDAQHQKDSVEKKRQVCSGKKGN